MTAKRKRGAGTLIRRADNTYAVRLPDGHGGKTLHKLNTSDPVQARAMADAIAAQEREKRENADVAGMVSTYAVAYFASRERRGLLNVKNDRGLWDLHWAPRIGSKQLADVTKADIRAVIRDAAEGRITKANGGRLAFESIANLFNIVRGLFKNAKRNDRITVSPCDDVSLSELANPDDLRPNTIMNDEEFRALIYSPHTSLEVRMMTILARSIGGMRTGDLYALKWSSFFVEGGQLKCRVPRKKTRRKRPPQLIEVPSVVTPFIASWWASQVKRWWTADGKPPSDAPVFPAKGKPMQHKKGKNSQASALRRDLMRALGVQTLVGGRWVTRKLATHRERELFEGTEDCGPVVFHSATRAAYASALARVGVNATTAQILTGHSDARTHQRYVRAEIVATPVAALPFTVQEAQAVSGSVSDEGQKPERSRDQHPIPKPKVRGSNPLGGAQGFSEVAGGNPQ